MAVVTSETASGDGSSDTISSRAPTFCIHVPTFETTCARNNPKKTRRASGASHDPGPVAEGLGVYLGHFPRERKSPGIGPDSDPSDPADDELVALTVMVRVDLLE